MCDLIFTTIGGSGTHVLVTACLSYVGNVFVLEKGDWLIVALFINLRELVYTVKHKNLNDL